MLCAADPAPFLQVRVHTIPPFPLSTLLSSHPHTLIPSQLCGEVVVRGCCSSLGDVKPEAVVRIVHVGEHIAQLYPAHFPQLLQPLLPMVLQRMLQEEVCEGGGREGAVSGKVQADKLPLPLPPPRTTLP